MATFGDSNYNSKLYSDYRPTYKKCLFDAIVAYHKSNNGTFGTAMDLGCGTGQATVELVDHFDKVIGVDGSAVMIQSATQHPKIEYIVGDCLEIPVPDHSVDLLVIGQAIHWFPIPKFWTEVKRVVKPGGTFGFWGYSNTISNKFPIITEFIWEFTTVTTGKYWDQGRKKLDELHQSYLEDIPFDNVQARLFFAHPKVELTEKAKKICDKNPGFVTNDLPDSGFVTPILNLAQLKNYMKTWSGYHNYLKNNPGAEDPVDVMINRIIMETGLRMDQDCGLLFPQEVVLSKV
jgi:ubiquinone/menaquinone biosynthesis C-methylase UbiE